MGEIPQNKQHQGSASHTMQGAETMSQLKPRVENEVSSGEDMTSAEEETSKSKNETAAISTFTNDEDPDKDPIAAVNEKNESETSIMQPMQNGYGLHKLNPIDRDSESQSEDESSSEDEEDDLTDVSERFGTDGEQVLGMTTEGNSSDLVPKINVAGATDVAADDDDSSISSQGSSNRSGMKKNLLEQLQDANSQLQEKLTKNQQLQAELEDERGRKKCIENNLEQLRLQYEEKINENAYMLMELNKKDELNSILEAKELELMQEVIDLKKKISEDLDMAHEMASGTYDAPSHLNCLNEELKTQLREAQTKLASSDALLVEKSAHMESLEREVVLLKEKIEMQSARVEEGGTERIEVEDMKAKVAGMVAEVIDESMSKVRIKELESEVYQLSEKLKNNEDKYAADMTEALSTLKQVQDAYGDMRDIVLEEYKNEIVHLTERVRIAEENSNEGIITGLRQELLDSRLQHERMKQSCEDEKETLRKSLSEGDTKHKELVHLVQELKTDLDMKTEQNRTIQSSLQKSQTIADERKETVNELGNQIKQHMLDIESLNKAIVEKDTETGRLNSQLMKLEEKEEKERGEKEALQLEVDVMESVKDQNKRLENEVQEMTHKLKLRSTKIKFLKKHVKELEKQKQKAEEVMLAIPDMQRKIEELSAEKTKMEENIVLKQKEEEERKRKDEEEKKLREDSVRKEKEDWERRILGIGKCMEVHQEENKGSVESALPQQERPNSAPLLQPRPPSSRRAATSKEGKLKSNSSSKSASNFASAPTLNPPYLQSYPQGIKTTRKMKERQEKYLFSQSFPSPCGGSFSSVTKPFTYYDASFKHMKTFPNISSKKRGKGDAGAGGSPNPRVLVWGEAEGSTSRMLAVGDHVLTNIHSECSTHGHLAKQQSAVVKYIGFVNGNEGDVYVGIRLQEDIGYTDGTIQGKRYFRCEPEKGAFVHLSDIVRVVQTQTKHVPSLASM